MRIKINICIFTKNLKHKVMEEVVKLYLVYVNDFLTVERFAEYYGFSIEYANALINEGRRISNAK